METLSRPPGFPRPFGSRHILLKELARGGMGRIFLTLTGGRVCAVKTLLPDLADPGLIRRFLDEATLATQLSHPNLVYVSEAGTEEGTPYLTMEYLRGKNLNEVFLRCAERKKYFPLGFAFFIIKEVLRGLSYMHGVEGLHLVHRDVAPSNVVLSYEGSVKIIDLGLAKWRDRLSETMVGGGDFGQRRYGSPEQKLGQPVDARSDIYSAGVILWEMVARRALVRKPDATGTLPDIPMPSQLDPTLPRALDQLVMGCLTDNPADRFQSAEEVMAILTPNMSAEYEATALRTFLADLFGDDIRREADEEKGLVARAKEIAPMQVVPVSVIPAEMQLTVQDSSIPITPARRWILPAGGLALLTAVVAAWFGLRSPATSGQGTIQPPVTAPLNTVFPSADADATPRSAPAAPTVTRIAPPPPAPPSSPRRVARSASARSLEEARSLYRRSAFAEAGAIAERVVDSDRDDLGAHVFLGDIYLKRGMYEKALAQYQEALKLSPNEAAALRGRDLARARMR
jgi:tetratricopeptide (TPR) repeat protein